MTDGAGGFNYSILCVWPANENFFMYDQPRSLNAECLGVSVIA